MGKREARPGIPRTVILTDDYCMTDQEKRQLANRLKAYLSKSEFNQHAVAEGIGRSTGYVSNVFSGKCDLELGEFVFICRLLNMNPGDFLNEALQQRAYTKDSSLEDAAEKLPKTELEECKAAIEKLQRVLFDEK